MSDIQVHMMPKPIADGDTGPQVVIGFTNEKFSHAVYLDAPQNAADAVQVADAFYKGYLEAAGAAVKAWIDKEQKDLVPEPEEYA